MKVVDLEFRNHLFKLIELFVITLTAIFIVPGISNEAKSFVIHFFLFGLMMVGILVMTFSQEESRYKKHIYQLVLALYFSGIVAFLLSIMDPEKLIFQWIGLGMIFFYCMSLVLDILFSKKIVKM